MDKAREELLTWSKTPGILNPVDMGHWYKGEHFNPLPDRATALAEGAAGILKGWLPARPIITRHTRVQALGSCFASYYVLWLADNGFNRDNRRSPYDALIRGNHFESPATVAQQFRWAAGEAKTENLLWVHSDKEELHATEQHRVALRDRLDSTDVIILTLGLSEVWYDKLTGEPLWRAVPERLYDPQRHVFRVESFSDTKSHIQAIIRLRDTFWPGLKIVFSVSPIPLQATFRPVSAVTASSVSKALIRAALDEALRERWNSVGETLFYFPSYEIVGSLPEPFGDDGRHVREEVVADVIHAFTRHYCELS